MRDLILLAAMLGLAPLILRAPVVGLLTWLWISLMNPQREVYGLLSGFPLNFFVAAMTLAAWALSRERKMASPNAFVGFLLLFMAWSSVCTYLAIDRDYAFKGWDRLFKTVILILAVATLADTRTRVQAVVWAVVVSLGYYAVKGGGFVLMTGGSQRVFGPEDSMIADNNSLGLALVVILPLLGYLRGTSQSRLVRLGCLAVMGLCIIAVIGTYSRGALLALLAAGAVLALRTRYGAPLLAAAAIASGALVSVMPAGWLDRMSTIDDYQADASFEGRVAAWRTAVNIAQARPLTGAGFSATDLDAVVQQFQSPGSLTVGRAAHSIYFEVLGDTGFVGLGLYLLAVLAAVLNTVLVRAAARGRPDLAWADLLARMLQVSFAAILVGGAALSMAYYDGFLVLMALSACLRLAVRQPATASSPAARWSVARARPSFPSAAPVASKTTVR